MALAEAILHILDNPEEPLKKRIRLADNAFISTEVPIQQKEAFLFKWAVNSLVRNNKNEDEFLMLLAKWSQSEQFNELDRNDIGICDIIFIVDVIIEKLKSTESCESNTDEIVNLALLVLNNKIFQDYLKQDLKKHCQISSLIISHIKDTKTFLETVKKLCLFSREIALQEKFYRHFLDVVLPSLVQKWIELQNEEVFLDISKILQKCLYLNQSSNFEGYLSHFFEEKSADTSVEKKITGIPKAVLKYLCSCCEQDSEHFKANFKLIFHSFCVSFKPNSGLIYKFLVILLQVVGFDISSTFKFHKTAKVKSNIEFKKSLDVYDCFLEILISSNISIDAKVQDVAFVDVTRVMLKKFIDLKIPHAENYEITLKTIKVNPLVIEPIVGQVITFIMLANNENQTKLYEDLVIAILKVFAKLHRTQNFVSRIIPDLKKALNDSNDAKEGEYQFVGKHNLVVTNMFTENILQYFTKCICDLASWQVINLFKTLLFHMKEAVQEFSESDETPDKNKLVFLEILATLTCRLMQSSKMADHTVTANTVEKFVKGLEDLKVILGSFGTAILKKEHNPTTMRTFLSMCFNWAEMYITLAYYSSNEDVKLTKTIDNNYSACNLMYLHSYLNVKQWQLISQRITNFGEYPCKRLLQKLYVQKIKALTLFENNFNDSISTNVVKQIQDHMEETWKDFLRDKFVIRHLFPKMDVKSKLTLAENILKEENLRDLPHLIDSIEFVNVLVYATMSRVNRIFIKNKKKQKSGQVEFISTDFFSNITEEFYENEDFHAADVTQNVVEKIWNAHIDTDFSVHQDKIEKHLNTLKEVPFIYSNIEIQKTIFIFIFCLHKDILSNQKLKKTCEELLIGILQSSKFCVSEILDVEKLFLNILEDFERHEQIFSLILINTLKKEDNLTKLEACVNCLLENVEDPKYLKSCLAVFKGLNNLPKSKTNLELKNQLKENILNKISKHISKTDHCIEAYAVCLKYYLSVNEATENVKKMLKKLPSFIELSFKTKVTTENIVGSLALFLTILHNKQKVEDLEEDFVLKVWKWLKNIDIQFSDFEEYSQLVRLVITLIPNEKFHVIVEDLLKLTLQNIQSKRIPALKKQLKIWKSALSCNINPFKMNIWQKTVENLVQSLLDVIGSFEFDEELFTSVVDFEECVIQTNHFILSSNLIDSFLITPTTLMTTHRCHFEENFAHSMTILEKLLSHRNALIMDRLPAFLLQYRILLKALCDRSNSELNLNHSEINKMADFAHRMEKLTKKLVACKKDMSRIALYLVADILERYERINLYSSVKLHLNNCIYSLISLCDHHAVSYLMRVLSSASTEMFKIMYEHYKKYYMFTGKV